MKEGDRLWITNGEVAWEIPPGPIAHRYASQLYQPVEPWVIIYAEKLPGWKEGRCGELRRHYDDLPATKAGRP